MITFLSSFVVVVIFYQLIAAREVTAARVVKVARVEMVTVLAAVEHVAGDLGSFELASVELAWKADHF